MQNEAWKLCKDAVVLGRLTLQSFDMPAFFCRFQPTAHFEPYRPLFEAELKILNGERFDERIDEYEAALGEIDKLGLILRPLQDAPPIEIFCSTSKMILLGSNIDLAA